jgi:hypothetical protein
MVTTASCIDFDCCMAFWALVMAQTSSSVSRRDNAKRNHCSVKQSLKVVLTASARHERQQLGGEHWADVEEGVRKAGRG